MRRYRRGRAPSFLQKTACSTEGEAEKYGETLKTAGGEETAEDLRGSGAAEESRTLDLNLGKVALYQLSYCRFKVLPGAA